MKFAVITDSSAGISGEKAQELGIYVTRMPLMIDGKEYIEEEDITRDEFIQAMRNGATVSTSQPPLGVLMSTFDDLLETHDHIFYLPISSKLSGTYQTALQLSKDYNGRVTVIDSKLVATPLLYITLDVKKLAEAGIDPAIIKERVELEAEMFAPLIPEDIQYLKRGGRITPTAAAIANLLKIFPILKVADGEIDLLEKVRTHKKAVKIGIEKILENRNIDDYEFAVVDGDCDSELFNNVVAELEGRVGKPVQQEMLYPIVLAHTGPGSIAVFAYKKIN